MEPVRILHIVYRLNRGGLENRIMDLYRNLNRDKYQYDFYIESGGVGMHDEEVRKLGGKIYYSQGINKYNIPNFKAFNLFLKKHIEYKIVYAYDQWAGWYLKEAKKCGVPYRIANARTSIQTLSIKNIAKNIVKLNVNKYATHRFAVSKRAADWLFGKRQSGLNHINIWPNAIDTKKFIYSESVRDDIRKDLGFNDNFIVLHVGNIRYEKNHAYLIKVFAEVKHILPSARLLLVGGGNFELLKNQIEDLGIENDVKYLGVRNDIPKLLQAGDVFVFPSLYEGFPGAVLEAETAGLPCFISDTITDEVVLTDYVRQLSIKIHPKYWAQEILKCVGLSRRDGVEIIKEAGYDIKNLVIEIEVFYDNMLNDFV